MDRLRRLARSFRAHPRYVAMRAVARFVTIRRIAGWTFGRLNRAATERYRRNLNSGGNSTLFPDLDTRQFVDSLRMNGVAFGLQLPKEMTGEISQFAHSTPCYADREASQGFHLQDRAGVEESLNKPILVAQYFNTEEGCGAIRRLRDDPVIQVIAMEYLLTEPRLVGVDLWWTFPVEATEADRRRHAHLFHRDVDDFRFLKFFFYITDVGASDGPHVFVTGSHRLPLHNRIRNRLSLRRLTDTEVQERFGADSINVILGAAGDGFAEDTFGVHKGTTPTGKPRLILQLQFAMFDYGNTDDLREARSLGMVV